MNRWAFRSRQNRGSESVVLSTTGSLFHSLGANRAKRLGLGRVDRCRPFFSDADLREFSAVLFFLQQILLARNNHSQCTECPPRTIGTLGYLKGAHEEPKWRGHVGCPKALQRLSGASVTNILHIKPGVLVEPGLRGGKRGGSIKHQQTERMIPLLQRWPHKAKHIKRENPSE